ncbi:endolytic transglycosylase MltG [Patescibacteria group bacterium]|nr:endolytic transglycosylase MltG [Patescibacteria group bacterium]MBU2219140.1 endolytic transglycosylase MltG [Patescibacteria group bacterium]MBU2263113.1 endolytic transglycosylase MltG [Patescibacteria group bacterium]
MKFQYRYRILLELAIVFTAFLFVFYGIVFAPPKNFPSQGFARVIEGSSVLQVGEKLKEDNVIRSRTIFVVLAKIMGLEKEIKSGDYFFEKPVSIMEIIRRLGSGDFGLKQIKVTIPEGATLKDIARTFENFENFDESEFYLFAKDPSLEGYLFPDTYFVMPTIDASGVIKIMKTNFEKKIRDFEEKIKESKYNLNEIITMASLIEKEVPSMEDKKIVSDILWKRLEIGMPLQVDAAYDTYLYKGLLPTPICNPGLESIEAAIYPVDSPYLYYLSGKDGSTYFAKTFEEHKINKAKYLK